MIYWSHNQNLKLFFSNTFMSSAFNVKYKAQVRFCCFQASVFHSCMSISLMVSVSSKSITKSRCQGETQTEKTGYPVACTAVTLRGIAVRQHTIMYYVFSSAYFCKTLQMSYYFRLNYLIFKLIFFRKSLLAALSKKVKFAKSTQHWLSNA